MSKHLLFVVHGMGVHELGWETEIKNKLEELAGRYKAFQATPSKLWDEIELVPVRYDGILSDTLAQWRQEAGGVMSFVAKHKAAGAGGLDWIGELAEQDEEFLWTHAGDVIIYRFFKLQREAIRVSVVKQIVERVLAQPDRDWDNCSLLAHSLGTAVLHDALHLLGTTKFAGFANAFNPLNARFRSIFMLANTSRVLQDDIQAYDSIVGGGPRTSSVTDASLFISAYHELDPFCIVKRFAPDKWSPQFNALLPLNHFRDWDVHGFTHYLDNPRLHIPLFNMICGRNVVPPSERIKTVDRYEKFGGRLRTVPEITARLQELAMELQKLHENATLGELFGIASRVRKLMLAIAAQVETLKATLADDLKKGIEP